MSNSFVLKIMAAWVVSIGLLGYLILRRKKRFCIQTRLVLTTIINKTQIKILAMQLNKQQFVDTILALVNSETQEPVAGATFSNIQLASSDPNIFTADTDPNNDGITDVVGVNEGIATLNVKADVNYIDPNTGNGVNASKEANVEVTVQAAPPGAINTDMIVTFSEAQPV